MAKLLWSLALLASTVSGRPNGLRALFARDAPSVAVSEYFVEPAPDFAHRARTFRVDALPETEELVAPFVGTTFRSPFVKVQLDGGETTGYCEGGKCYVDDVDPDDFDECDEYYCGNDPYWRYDAGDKGPLGCDDIAAEPEKIEKRCRTQERVGVDATGREVRASVACKGVCRESCEGC